MQALEARRASVTFELASIADDRELRDLLRATPMRGGIDLTFLREPSYFQFARAQGEMTQTLVARARGSVVGVATRAIRPTWINGELVSGGYLGDLRLAPQFRGGTVLARGYRYLRDLHEDGAASCYSTVIVDDNETALRTLAANRAGLPRYEPLGRILTPMLSVRRRRPQTRAQVERGSLRRLPQIVEKLNENRGQFAIRYRVEDFTSGRFPGLRPEDFWIVWRRHQIAGVLAVWDQRTFRQTVALGYRGWLRWLRPWARVLGNAPLPPVGQPLAHAFAAFVSTDDDQAFRDLLECACGDARERGLTHLIVGLHERDPRLPVLTAFPRIPFAGRLFSVSWDDPPELDGRVPFVEAALL